jgi:hypothetical protein
VDHRPRQEAEAVHPVPSHHRTQLRGGAASLFFFWFVVCPAKGVAASKKEQLSQSCYLREVEAVNILSSDRMLRRLRSLLPLSFGLAGRMQLQSLRVGRMRINRRVRLSCSHLPLTEGGILSFSTQLSGFACRTPVECLFLSMEVAATLPILGIEICGFCSRQVLNRYICS